MAVSDRRRGQFAEVRSFVGEVFGAGLHAKRIDSLAGATLGVMQSASLAVAMIGQALALARGLVTKKSNTSKTRTHSLFRQGCMLYELIPNMPEHRLTPLMEKFGEAVSGAGLFPTAIGASK